MRLATVLIFSAALILAAAEISPRPDGLTVHEWGTFTSVAGVDGSATDWDTLGCKDDLPGFVHDFGYRGFKFRLQGTVRMETPVMYFYSARELDARVRVEFPQGLITEWYPRATYEVYRNGRRLGANLNGIDTSLRSVTGAIEWKDIKVQPDAAPALPMSSPSRYYAARSTDAAPIRVGDQQEKFLFYRGVGRFAVPLSARLSDEGKVVVENRGSGRVPAVILFENRGGQLGYRSAGAMDSAATLDRPPLDGSVTSLRRDLEAALVAQGLYPKEARAMIETWRDSWFEEGSRAIYVLGTAAVDTILPLDVEPAPSQIARVFVGRIELLTPETVGAVEQAVAKHDGAAIERYRRFLDPILQRASKVSRNQEFARNCR